MDKITSKALENSIRKWSRIVNGTGFDNGIVNCSLCKIYHGIDCRGCPVMKKTKKSGCVKTPYDTWINHQENYHRHFFFPVEIHGECRTCKSLAKRELEFLKSLRKEVKE